LLITKVSLKKAKEKINPRKTKAKGKSGDP